MTRPRTVPCKAEAVREGYGGSKAAAAVPNRPAPQLGGAMAVAKSSWGELTAREGRANYRSIDGVAHGPCRQSLPRTYGFTCPASVGQVNLLPAEASIVEMPLFDK